MKNKYFFGVLALLLHFSANATRFTVQQQITLNIPAKNAYLYLLHNRSKQSYWLLHVSNNKDPGASAGWSSRIDPGRWSAILMSKPNFVLGCQWVRVSQTGKLSSCENAITVMHATNYHIPSKYTGASFWVAENMKKRQLYQQLKQRGFKK